MTIEMDQETRKHLEEIAKTAKYKPGIWLIDQGKCPAGAKHAVACTFCPLGHSLECHYPMTCQQAECSHMQYDAG
jgi:hypothetical protein